MKRQKSCGVIPYTIKNNEIYVLLVKQTNDVICFPKGHTEEGETEEETAVRECMEETNTKVSIVDGFREEMGYYMEEYDAYKTVVYFLGKIESDRMVKQDSEISDIFLCNADEAMNLLAYDNLKDIFLNALKYLDTQKMMV